MDRHGSSQESLQMNIRGDSNRLETLTDFTSRPQIQTLGFLDIRILGFLEIRILRCLDNRIAGNLDSRKFGYAEMRTAGYPDIQKCGYPDIRKSGYPEIRTSGSPDMSPRVLESQELLTQYSDCRAKIRAVKLLSPNSNRSSWQSQNNAISNDPDTQDHWISGYPKSGYPDFPDFRISGYPDIRKLDDCLRAISEA